MFKMFGIKRYPIIFNIKRCQALVTMALVLCFVGTGAPSETEINMQIPPEASIVNYEPVSLKRLLCFSCATCLPVGALVGGYLGLADPWEVVVTGSIGGLTTTASFYVIFRGVEYLVALRSNARRRIAYLASNPVGRGIEDHSTDDIVAQVNSS